MNSNGNEARTFDDFVKSQQPAPDEMRAIDWTRERDEWLGSLGELYKKIEAFLAKYIEAGEITIERRDITLNEENIGSYAACRMILKIGRQEITLTPIGTLLVAAKGRVDVVGPAGKTRLVLVDSESSRPSVGVAMTVGGRRGPSPVKSSPKKIKWVWKIATPPPSVRYIELTPESFFQAIMEIVNG